MTIKSGISTTALLLALVTLAPINAASSQTATESPKSDSTHSDPASWPVHTYYLKNHDQANLNDVATTLRNIFGASRDTAIVAESSQGAIVVRENPADIPIVEKIIAELDRSRKAYRVTYTLSEMDNNKRVGSQHFAVVMSAGQRTKFEQGSKVPIAQGNFTGTGKDGGLGVQTQFTYMDVDLTVTATLEDIGTAGSLRYDLDQASVAPAPADAPQNPIIRHTSLTGEATLTPNKPLMLGSIDYPGSTRRLDVEALMEPLP